LILAPNKCAVEFKKEIAFTKECGNSLSHQYKECGIIAVLIFAYIIGAAKTHHALSWLAVM